ncbi:MAG: hydrogenase [Treponema sp.]|jgi:nitrogenase molybdenum-iron protein beta chain|nr:hydrogenase [Treponema sp.]
MTEYIEKPRYVCALGAFETALAIEGVVPILHAGPGCGAKLGGGIGTLNGCQGSGRVNPHILPSTNIGEREVVFGGGERLAETIEGALKMYRGDLFVVFSGCTAAIVGDDIGEVASRFADAEKPILYVDGAGFKGNNLYGHETLWDTLIRDYLKPAEKLYPRRINVFSSVPFQHPFWYGDLRELARLLEAIGLEPNIVYGPGGGVSALDAIPGAEYNLLVSPWVSLKNMRHLRERFGTPFLHEPVLPIGPTETGNFLRRVADFTGMETEGVRNFIDWEEGEYYYLVERAADEMVKTRLLPTRFITIADSLYGLGITRFLVNDMGLIPRTQYITDQVPEEYQEGIREAMRGLEGGISAPAVFVSGSGEAQDLIARGGFANKAFILGSGWERTFSAAQGTLSLPVATPLLDRMVLNRSYVGYHGALTLLEDMCSLILGRYQ